MNEKVKMILLQNQALFHPVVQFDPSKDKLIKLNLTEENTALTEDIFNDIVRFTSFINDELNTAHARYGIGGYNELRKLYSRSDVFDGDISGTPRRLHLGTDIWGKPYTAVMAPLDAIVHSLAFNNREGDYGATIILTHQLEGVSFYSLYGHLSLSSIKNIQPGDSIYKGDIFAEFGIPIENGHWPPHLHFQLILDLGEWKGDYPGVCSYDEKEQWLLNSPDPDIILQLNKYISS